MENRAHALLAGLFVLCLGAAAVFALWSFGDKRDRLDTYVLETRRNVTGLNLQAQVRYRGIRAGKVTAIAPDPADPRVILIRIDIDDRYKLTRATTAKLGYQGITGLAYVQLEDDGASRDYLDPDGPTPPRIAMKATVFDTLGERAEDIVGQVAELTARLSRLVDDKNAAKLARTLDNVAEASAGLKQVPQVLAAARAVLSDANLKKLQQILAHLERTAGETAPLATELRESVRAMGALAQRLDTLAATAGDQVTQTTLPQLQGLLRELNANSRQIGRILETLDDNPQALLFGKGASRPGPGEAGFAAPPAVEK